MSNANGAEIIQFPGFFRPPAAEQLLPAELAEVSTPVDNTPPVSSPPASLDAEDPSLRLHRALAMLNAALEEQRVAVAAWRSALVELNGSVRGLGSSLSRYQDTLKSVAPAYRQKG